jgi:hypothetical protein
MGRLRAHPKNGCRLPATNAVAARLDGQSLADERGSRWPTREAVAGRPESREK